MSMTEDQMIEFRSLISRMNDLNIGDDYEIAQYVYEYQQAKIDELMPKGCNAERLKSAREIIQFLNDKTGRNYRPVPVNLSMICARLKEGATVQELRQVIVKKSRQWAGDEKMEIYLRPATLFNREKFAQYQGELV